MVNNLGVFTTRTLWNGAQHLVVCKHVREKSHLWLFSYFIWFRSHLRRHKCFKKTVINKDNSRGGDCVLINADSFACRSLSGKTPSLNQLKSNRRLNVTTAPANRSVSLPWWMFTHTQTALEWLISIFKEVRFGTWSLMSRRSTSLHLMSHSPVPVRICAGWNRTGSVRWRCWCTAAQTSSSWSFQIQRCPGFPHSCRSLRHFKAEKRGTNKQFLFHVTETSKSQQPY